MAFPKNSSMNIDIKKQAFNHITQLLFVFNKKKLH